eukprot:5846729-Alexandrium_andersonii.AAC.1
MQSLRKDRGYRGSSGAAGSDLRAKRLADRKARTRCMACGQTGHWQGDAVCPKHRAGDGRSGGGTQVHFVLMAENGSHDDGYGSADLPGQPPLDSDREPSSAGNPWMVLLTSTRNRAILDTGCQRNVCGDEWLKTHVQHLETLGMRISSTPEHETFRFGDQKTLTSQRRCVIPVGIFGCNGVVTTSVVKGSLPLLLGRPALEKLGV